MKNLHIRILNLAYDYPKFQWVEIFAKPALAITHPILFAEEWVKYSWFFFRKVPVNIWPGYIPSAWRVTIASVYGELEMREAAKEGVWELHARKQELKSVVEKEKPTLVDPQSSLHSSEQ